jgi:Uma2 family endonuclease
MATAPMRITEAEASRSDVSGGNPFPLENGDHLTRLEFERRYRGMPEVKKAELIGGIVFMGSPVRFHAHGRPHSQLQFWLAAYELETPGVLLADSATTRLDADNEVQPDLLLMIDPRLGGQARVSEDDYIEGTPELVVEIASSSASYDLHSKLQVYRRGGVREYLVWRVLDRALDWFVLHEGAYVPLAADAAGILKSPGLGGLWLDPAALLRGEMPTVLARLREGLASPEHAALLARLQPTA